MNETSTETLPDLPLVKAETAAEICDTCALREEALDLLEDEMAPDAYLQALMDGELYPDAIKFLAQALPKRDAVIWARSCAQEAAGEEPTEADATCLEMIERWLVDPSEDNRRAAMDVADEAVYATAVAAAAAAAGWTEGSMGPAEYDDVPPPENLTGTMVASAVLLASVAGDPAEAKATQKGFLERGVGIAGGGD
jgi:hypothetical protein